MPISMGIMCETCRIVYLINSAGRNHRIEYGSRGATPEAYTLRCVPCGRSRSFHKPDMKPYSVSALVYARGYAEPGEYNDQSAVSNRTSIFKSRSMRSTD